MKSLKDFQKDVLLASREKPVLAKFSATWCNPCKMLTPVLKQIIESHDVTVVEIDIDEHPGVSAEWRIRGVPTLMLFYGGEPVGTMVGAATKAQVLKFIADNIAV